MNTCTYIPIKRDIYKNNIALTSVTLTPNLTLKKVGDSLSTVKNPQTAPT